MNGIFAGLPVLTLEEASLFGVYFMVALDTFSSAHSSPYTAEVRGGSPENRERVMHWAHIGGGVAVMMGVGVALFSRNGWPAVGVLAGSTVMIGLYHHGLSRAKVDTEQELG
ncbi:MAG TPA: hypothetical protein VKU91_01425 [Acidimicrobiales bacterium]|nr:hypothetical protein [Acidimicrobiales bacterium]